MPERGNVSRKYRILLLESSSVSDEEGADLPQGAYKAYVTNARRKPCLQKASDNALHERSARSTKAKRKPDNVSHEKCFSKNQRPSSSSSVRSNAGIKCSKKYSTERMCFSCSASSMVRFA